MQVVRGSAMILTTHMAESPRPPAAARIRFDCREDDRDYMSSEGSQLGSSMGDITSNMPYDYPSARSSSSSVRPSIHEAAQGLAHLAMLGAPSRERAPAYAGSRTGMPTSLGHGREDAYGHAPFQHSGQPETFRRGMARAAAARGPPDADYGEGAAILNRLVVSQISVESQVDFGK